MLNQGENLGHRDIDLLSRELELTSLVQQVAGVMHAASSLDQALRACVLGTLELTGLAKVALFGIREGESRLELIHGAGIDEGAMAALRPAKAHAPIHACLASHRHILVETVGDDDPFAAVGSRSYLVLPVTARSGESSPRTPWRIQPLGIAWLDTTPPAAPLSAQQISHVAGLCQQTGLLMETFRIQRELADANTQLQHSHARLHDAYTALSRAQRRIEEDLDRARAIQGALLPASFPMPLLRGAASKYIPAGKVGGDYFDCFELPGGRLGMVIADVSGHGIAAALIMSMFKALLRNFSLQDASPSAALNHINRIFLEQFAGSHFVTAFYGIFDPPSRRLTWSNAGHVAQYLVTPERTLELPSHGLVLGIFPDTFIKDAAVTLERESRLFLYTDGITESHARDGRMFGQEPLLRIVSSTLEDTPAAVIDALLAARDAFTGKTVPSSPEGRAATPQENSSQGIDNPGQRVLQSKATGLEKGVISPSKTGPLTGLDPSNPEIGTFPEEDLSDDVTLLVLDL